MKDVMEHPSHPRVHGSGPWPFITFRTYDLIGRHIVWRDRQHRKGLVRTARALEAVRVPFWQTQSYNWYVGLIFAIGSALFMLGSALSVLPDGGGVSALAINAIFFAGSIPFTTAGYLQHFQAANASEFATDPASHAPHGRIKLIGWRPHNPGWLSTLSQFIGTVAFNFNTFDAIDAPVSPDMQNLVIWLPGVIGSILFLVSAYLAFIEAGHGYWSWKPRDLDWQIVSINLLGCVAFMVASTIAYIPQGPEPGWIAVAANAQLFIGALCFLIGAVLSMRESRLAAGS